MLRTIQSVASESRNMNAGEPMSGVTGVFELGAKTRTVSSQLNRYVVTATKLLHLNY
jgi:hypothetical protein